LAVEQIANELEFESSIAPFAAVSGTGKCAGQMLG